MSDRTEAIIRLAASMGYQATPGHVAQIEALVDRLIRHRYAELLTPPLFLTVDAERVVEDALNPTLREAVRTVMNQAIAAGITAAPRHN